MITNRTRVTFENGTTIEVDKGTSLYELSMKYQPEMKHKIVGAEINNEVVPLDYRINKESTVMFLDATYINGYKLAKAGLEFVIEVALKEEFGRDYEVEYDYSILSEVYMTIKGPKKFTLPDAKKLKAKMNEIIANDEIIQRLNVDKKEAILNFVGNTTMFIPIGIIFPAVYKELNTPFKVIAGGVGFSLCVEIFQLPFCDRVTDIDDLLMNTLGYLVGYGVYLGVKKF